MAQHQTNSVGAPRDNEFSLQSLPADLQGYLKLLRNTVVNRQAFWDTRAKHLTWDTPYTTVFAEDTAAAAIEWFIDGELNPYTNVKNVFAGKKGTVLTCYGPGDTVQRITTGELFFRVDQTARALNAIGVGSSGRVALYTPDRIETIVIMLACAGMGITYVPIPHHYTAEITAEITGDCGATVLFTDFSSSRASHVERAQKLAGMLTDVTVISIGGSEIDDVMDFDTFLAKGGKSPDSVTASTESRHPLFILYANSATGIPRGSVFATGGYLVQAATSYDTIFRESPDSIHSEKLACTLNLASAAGQCYGFWGPLLNGARIVLFEDTENISAGCLKRVAADNSPIALISTPQQLLTVRDELGDEPASFGDDVFAPVACCGDMLTPRMVAFVGKTLARSKESVLNLWIQSESGAALISTYPSPDLNRPGALGLAAPGIKPVVVNNLGQPCRPNESGQLVFSGSWPGMIRTIWGQGERFRELYFQRNTGYFSTNDGVRMDNEGVFWFMGRLDDVIKIRGQSLATSEIEVVLVTNPEIHEAAVVGYSEGEDKGLIAFLAVDETFIIDPEKSRALENDSIESIIRRIGEFAVPSRFVFTQELPHTRTGKVVRRILRRIATGNIAEDEDLSHVSNPKSVEEIVKNKGL